MVAHHDRLAAGVARGAPAMVSATAVMMMTNTVGNHGTTVSSQHDVILVPLWRKQRAPSIAPSRRSRSRQVDLLGLIALQCLGLEDFDTETGDPHISARAR